MSDDTQHIVGRTVVAASYTDEYEGTLALTLDDGTQYRITGHGYEVDNVGVRVLDVEALAEEAIELAAEEARRAEQKAKAQRRWDALPEEEKERQRRAGRAMRVAAMHTFASDQVSRYVIGKAAVVPIEKTKARRS